MTAFPIRSSGAAPGAALLLAIAAAGALRAERVLVENDTLRMEWDSSGGTLVRLERHDTPLNPFTWGEPGPGPRPRGHFLCLDRWGAPTAAERARGVPFHGEAARVDWKITSRGTAFVEMETTLPLARLHVSRRVRLHPAGAFVEETVRNLDALGRVYNLVQHPTIAPPFLDEQALVDANARRGFAQSAPLPNPEQPSFFWPQALRDGEPVSVRVLHDDPAPNVVSYVIDDDLGWVTALSPSSGLLLGYVWKTADYPWLNLWRHADRGRPAARGLEFGTTGLHQPYPILVRKGRIFGRPLFDHLDADEARTRSYSVFLEKAGPLAEGVARIAREDGSLILEGRRGGRLKIGDPSAAR